MNGRPLNPSFVSGLKIAALAGLALALSGCALLSTPKPVTLYRFGTLPTEGAAGADAASPVPSPVSSPVSSPVPSPASSPVPVALRRIDFPAASTGDRILGVTGTQAAYIAGARWVSPAETLFSDGLEAAFNAQPGRVRLIGRREPGIATRVLGLDVTTFEARYDVAGAAPTIVITARARMTVLPQRSVVSERVFSVSRPATENRVGAIVDAFDIASRDLNTQIVDWTAFATR